MTMLGPLTVSRLGYGTLSLSPLQSSLEVEQGADLLCYAWTKGIRFWDTAQIYDNYPVLRAALKRLAQAPVIASKTYAWSAQDAEAALEEARRELDLDVLDIMLLHEQTALTLRGHEPALNWLARAKGQGKIRAVGVSTHSIACVQAAAELEQIDVIHPLYNKWGTGIHDGTAQDMAAAIAQAKARGKGIYGMKVLGGGTAYRQSQQGIEHALAQPWLDSMVIGMSNREEIDFNTLVCTGQQPGADLLDKVTNRSRQLHVADWCEGCGSCLAACSQGALVLEGERVMVDPEKCILCGYCSRECQHMCLKIV